MAQARSKCGILLVNTGTPTEPTPKAVRAYLGRFLMDKRIAPMNRVLWWIILHLFILPKRGVASAEKYRLIWSDEGSPLKIGHEKLVQGLMRAYSSAGYEDSVAVRYAMNYSEPFIADSLQELACEGCSHVVLLPLYPQSAYSTAGAVVDSFERALRKTRWAGTYEVVPNYHDNPTYIKAIAASIVHAGFRVESNDSLLFSFHSIPIPDIEAGDTYELQTGSSCLQIANTLGLDRRRWTMGYMCRFDKGREWLSPFSKDVLTRWAQADMGRVFIVCPNFAVDCLETYYDVGHMLKDVYAQALHASGKPFREEDFVYVPCLDRSKAHARVLFDVTEPYVRRKPKR